MPEPVLRQKRRVPLIYAVVVAIGALTVTVIDTSIAAAEQITETIVVSGSYDGGGKRVTGWGGGQEEGQRPLFDVRPGGTVSNVRIGAPAGDGIHCQASCTLRNVVWEDVGEDAATLMKNAPASAVMTVEGGSAANAADKVFQHNGAGTVVINNFTARDVHTLYRSCGTGSGCGNQPHRTVRMNNVTISNFGVVARINPGDTAVLHNIKASGGGDLCQLGTKTAPEGTCQIS